MNIGLLMFYTVIALLLGFTESLGQSTYEPYVFTTLAGSGSSGNANGTGTNAQFSFPGLLAVDSAGNVFVGDAPNHVIRKITPAGVVTTLAGLVGTSGSMDGSIADARFNGPAGVAVDETANLYVADYGNHTIRKITPSVGMVVTLAGLAGNPGIANGPGGDARFNGPSGIAVDTAGNLYVGDYLSHTIRKVTAAGAVTTLAGTAQSAGSVDGMGPAARFNQPYAIALDSSGNLYVADEVNQAIRKITPEGNVTTLAGLLANKGYADGTGTNARFHWPKGAAVDSTGNVYVGDTANQAIRKVTPTGVVTTLAGLAGTPGNSNGTGGDARFNNPFGVAIDRAGNLYVADTYNHTIRKGAPQVQGPIILTSNRTISESETQFEGKDVIVKGATLTLDGTHSFNSLTLTNVAILTHSACTPAETHKIDIYVTNHIIISADSRIDVEGKGYPQGHTTGNSTDQAAKGQAGASYGGRGGVVAGSTNPTYGDPANPNDWGSGSPSAAGGGLIRIRAKELVLEGSIHAPGQQGGFAGGGSGGSIYIEVSTIRGAGSIEANGQNNWVGGGGGGRVAIYALDYSGFDTNKVTALGGYDQMTFHHGETGSVHIVNTSWSKPTARYGAAIAFDTKRGEVVLVAGVATFQGIYDPRRGTWTWNGSFWTERVPDSPPPWRWGAAAAFDAARGEVVTFGGTLAGVNFANDTWVWDGSIWTNRLTDQAPSARYFYAIAYDSIRRNVLLFGGYADPTIYTDTWTWDGAQWTKHEPPNRPGPARFTPAMCFDEARGQVVLFGGSSSTADSAAYFNDTWVWDGTDWAKVEPTGDRPSGRSHARITYDSARHEVVLFGGYNETNLADTWVWNGTNWTRRFPAVSPSPRYAHSMAYDSIRQRVVMFGGYNSGTGELDDTWLWNGSTWSAAPASKPHTVSYDPTMGTLPDAQGFTKIEHAGHSAPTVSGGLLHQFLAAGDSTQFWYDSSLPLDFLHGTFVMEARLKIISSEYNPNISDGNQRSGYYLASFDSSARKFLIGISSTGITINNDASLSASKGVTFKNFDSTSNFHDYRFTVAGGTGSLFIDDNLFASLPVGEVSSLEVGTPYRAFFGDLAGRTGSTADLASFSATVYPDTVLIPPSIVQQPASLQVSLGNPASLTVVPAGTEPFSFQWRRNGTNIVGATNSTLTITNAQLSDMDNYTVRVSNGSGSIISDSASLVVLAQTILFEEDFERGTPGQSLATSPFNWTVMPELGGDVRIGTNSHPGWVGNAVVGALSPNGVFNGVRFPLPLPTNGIVTLTFDAWAYTQFYSAEIGFFGPDGLTAIYWAASANGTIDNTWSLIVDNPYTAVSPYERWFSPTRFMREQTARGRLVVDYDARQTWGELDDGTNVVVSERFSLQGTPKLAGIFIFYDRRAGTLCADFDNLKVTATSLPQTAPFIIAQPQSKSIAGGNATFLSVLVTGTESLTYQWRLNGSDVLGAANAILTIANAQLADAGDYTVRVSNAAGSVVSAAATLTVFDQVSPPAGLVAWFPGEGDVNDVVNGIKPVAQNGVMFPAGIFGRGIAHGPAGYTELAPTPTLANQHFTWSAWVRRDGAGPNENDGVGSTILSKEINGTDGRTYYGLHWRASDSRIRFTGGPETSFILSEPLSTGEFHHVAASYDGSAFRLYINGVLHGQLSSEVLANYDVPRPWTLGGNSVQDFHRTFNGVIDELQIFNRALFPGEIATIHGAGSVGASPIAPPFIAVHPLSQIVERDGTAILSVTATGLEPFTYQWQKNKNAISNATEASLILTPVELADGGLYTVVVSNAGGKVESNPALLQIELPLIALTDRFMDRLIFTNASFQGTTNNTNATLDFGEPRHAGKSASNSLWMTWKAPADGLATFTTIGSTFDTLLAVYTGNSIERLSPVPNGSSDDVTLEDGRFLTSSNSFNAHKDIEYHIAIAGYSGATGILVLSWNFIATEQRLPEIRQQPASVLTSVGAAVNFSVIAQNAGLTYQWLHNGEVLPGQTSPTLSFLADTLRVGTYRVRVRAPNGQEIESSDAILEVLNQPSPPDLRLQLSADKLDDLFAPGETAAASLREIRATAVGGSSQGTTQEGHFRDSTRSEDDPVSCAVITSATRWFRFRPIVPAGELKDEELSTEGSEVPTSIGVFTNRSALQLIACSPPQGVLGAKLRFKATNSVDYLVMVGCVGDQLGKFRLITRRTEELPDFIRPWNLNARRFEVQMFVSPGSYIWSGGPDAGRWAPMMQTNVSSGLFQYSEPLNLDAPARIFRLLSKP